MRAHRAAMLLAGGALFAAGSVGWAQSAGRIPDATLLNIMRECAKIDDPTARLACYDNNLRAGGFEGRGPTVPGRGSPVNGGRAPNANGSGAYSPQGFGAASMKNSDRFESYEDRGTGPDSITAKVAAVSQREPGVYLVTLEGGAQWLFSDTASIGFRPPNKGESVDISHAALGSFLMRVGKQEPVRVRRIN